MKKIPVIKAVFIVAAINFVILTAAIVKPGAEYPTVHIDKIIPRERQAIIADLAERLKQHPEIQAYLIGGSRLEEDGRRLIFTVLNSASRKIYRSGPMRPDLELNQAGIKILNESLLERGIPGGYQDNVFYQLNWDIDIFGREQIIMIGEAIKSAQ